MSACQSKEGQAWKIHVLPRTHFQEKNMFKLACGLRRMRDVEKSLHQPSEVLILDLPKHEGSGHLLRTLNAIMKSGKPHLISF